MWRRIHTGRKSVHFIKTGSLLALYGYDSHCPTPCCLKQSPTSKHHQSLDPTVNNIHRRFGSCAAYVGLLASVINMVAWRHNNDKADHRSLSSISSISIRDRLVDDLWKCCYIFMFQHECWCSRLHDNWARQAHLFVPQNMTTFNNTKPNCTRLVKNNINFGKILPNM